MARMRSPAQRAPQSIEAATELLARYAELDGRATDVEAQRAGEIAAINAAADAELVPLVAELKDIVKQLKPWWAASVEDLTGGRRKSIELGGCILGYRLSPPKVVYAHGNDDDATAALRTGGHEALVRTRHALDKPAILKILDGDDAGELEAMGFAASQREDFFVERAGQSGTIKA